MQFPPPSTPGAARRAAAATAKGLLGVGIVACGAWGTLALAVSGPAQPALRLSLAAGFAAASLAAVLGLAIRRWRRPALVVYGLLFIGTLAWFFSLRPSNERNWVDENAVLAHATVDGNFVTVHNIRNFSYRSETDFSPAYYDRRFDLRQLEGVDLVAVYWMGPQIAHVFLSFAFAGDQHLAISIEARKEKGEGYSTVNGFFRQYELYYVVADERDVIGLRTNYRADPPEQVYLYRLQGAGESGRRLFMAYIDQMNELAARPTFYNSLTTNCTTNIWTNALVVPEHLPFSWKVLVSGHVPEYLYEHGRLADADRPFAEVQRRALVNDRARASGVTTDFSRRIRGLRPAPINDPSRVSP